MQDIFTYPSNAAFHYVDQEFLPGMRQRIANFTGEVGSDTPYGKPYNGSPTPFTGKTDDEVIEYWSKYYGYYYVELGGSARKNIYNEVYTNPLIECTFTEHGFTITNATQANPVRVTTDGNHGMGDGTNNFNGDPLQFDISGVVGMTELNGDTVYCKVIDATTLDLYEDAALTTTLDGSAYTAYTSGGTFALNSSENDHIYKLDTFTLIDKSTRAYRFYDKDYYGGTLTNGDFGAYLCGATTAQFVEAGLTYSVNSVKGDDDPSNASYYPSISVSTVDDGAVYGTTTDGSSGTVSSVSFSGVNAGRFNENTDAVVKVVVKDSDDLPDTTLAITNITQASPGVITFSGNAEPSRASNNQTEGNRQLHAFNIQGMTELNGVRFYAKPIAYNQWELYENSDYSTALDTSGFSAYTTNGNVNDGNPHGYGASNDFDGTSILEAEGVTPTNWGPAVATATDSTGFFTWTTRKTPYQASYELLQPTRTSISQDLTKYRNSTLAANYRIRFDYRALTEDEARELTSYVEVANGQYKQFKLKIQGTYDDGGSVDLFGDTDSKASNWSNALLLQKAELNDQQILAYGVEPLTNNLVNRGDRFSGVSTYRNNSSLLENAAIVAQRTSSNIFGEAWVTFTRPLNKEIAQGQSLRQSNLESVTVTLADDEFSMKKMMNGYYSCSIEFDCV